MKKILLGMIIMLLLIGCSSSKRKVYQENELIAAVVADNVFVLNRAIRKGFDVNQILKNGDTLLTLALKENSLESISILLSNGANTNEYIPAKEILGTDIEIPSRPPLFYVNSLDALNLFIKDNVNLNQIDGSGELLLNFYIKTKPESLSIELIKNNADLKILDTSKWYPIFWAVNIENEEILKEILKKDKKQYLSKDEKLNYPIYYANSKEVMKILLEGNYNINETNIYGENILGQVYLKAKQLGYNDIVEILIKKGVNRNYKSYK